MKIGAKMPLSDMAGYKLKDEQDMYIAFPIIFFVVASVIFIPITFGAGGFAPGIVVSSATVFIWNFASSFLYLKKYKPERAKILSNNEIDFAKSCQLREILKKFSTLRSVSLPVVEGVIPGEWRPFRVEHALSNSLRAEVSREHIRGIATPNLFDSSSVVFLKKADAVLRVIVPSSRATQEMLKQTIGVCCKGVWRDSHVGNLIYNFSVEDDVLLYNISHPQLIDSIDASCEMPLEARPTVKVIGEKIQDGVVIATALEVNGRQEIFLPSGFFQKLLAEVAPVLGIAQQPSQKHVATLT